MIYFNHELVGIQYQGTTTENSWDSTNAQFSNFAVKAGATISANDLPPVENPDNYSCPSNLTLTGQIRSGYLRARAQNGASIKEHWFKITDIEVRSYFCEALPLTKLQLRRTALVSHLSHLSQVPHLSQVSRSLRTRHAAVAALCSELPNSIATECSFLSPKAENHVGFFLSNPPTHAHKFYLKRYILKVQNFNSILITEDSF
jgi:hypothetical protein